MSAVARPEPDRARVLTWLAIAYGCALVAFAAVVPVYTINTGNAGIQPRHSLVAEFGIRALGLALLPLVGAVLVTAALRRYDRNRQRWLLVFSWAVAGTMTIAAVALFVTIVIGVWLLPVAMLLLAAIAMTATGRPTSRPASLATP